MKYKTVSTIAAILCSLATQYRRTVKRYNKKQQHTGGPDMKTKSICSAFLAVVAIFLTAALFTGCGKREGNADHPSREDNAVSEAKDGENTEELSEKGNAAFEAKDLEIATIQLNQYRGTDGSRPSKGSTQSVSIANQSDKTIDLYDYSITNNGIEIVRIKEHVKLEKGKKKEFPLQSVNIETEIAPCFIESVIISNDEKKYQKEREKLETMMKRYLPYVTETNKQDFNALVSERFPFYFSEIALLSPQKETLDQILVTNVEVQKNPYSLVAFLNTRLSHKYTSIFRKGDYVVVCSVPAMEAFQIVRIGYWKNDKALTAYTKGNQYFIENTGFYVPDLNMTLHLYRDKDFKEEILYLEGQKFVFEKMSEVQIDSVEKFFDGLKAKEVEVYYKLFVTHPVFPELSFSEHVTGRALFVRNNGAMRTTSYKHNVDSATDGKK